MTTNFRKQKHITPVAILFVLLLIIFSPFDAGAHQQTGAGWGFGSGFLHPLSGADHIAAMVAVGLWGAFLGQPAMWLLPVVFPMVMAVGGVLGVLGVPVPQVEHGIALSSVALGAAVALAVKPPLWVSALLVGIFALFHGYAHGAEMPKAANAATYAVGFVIATGLLHLTGISVGLLTRWRWGRKVVRMGGLAIAILGLGFLFKFISA